jgi:RNA polymerase sigma factor (sigma-70 family)
MRSGERPFLAVLLRGRPTLYQHVSERLFAPKRLATLLAVDRIGMGSRIEVRRGWHCSSG